jgi:hypothetical protein
LLPALKVAVEDGDPGPPGCELPRSRFAQSRCRTSHDRSYSIDVHASSSVRYDGPA